MTKDERISPTWQRIFDAIFEMRNGQWGDGECRHDTGYRLVTVVSVSHCPQCGKVKDWSAELSMEASPTPPDDAAMHSG